MMGELDCLSENPKLMGIKLEEQEYFSRSLVETKKMQRDGPAERYPALKRSSSYNAERKKCCNPTARIGHPRRPYRDSNHYAIVADALQSLLLADSNSKEMKSKTKE